MPYKLSIKKKLFIYLVVIAMIPIIVLFIFTYKNNVDFYNEELVRNTITTNQKLVTNLEHRLDMLDSVLDALLYYEVNASYSIQQICIDESKELPPSPAQRLWSNRNFSKFGNQLAYGNTYIDGITIFTKKPYNYSLVKNSRSELDYNDLLDEWNKHSDKLTTGSFYSVINKKDTQLLLISRHVVDVATGKVVGMLTITCNLSFFDGIDNIETETSNSDSNKSWLLSSESLIPVLSSDSFSATDFLKTNAHSTYDNTTIYKNNTQLLFTTPVNDNQWVIASTAKTDNFYDMYRKNFVYLFIVTFMVFFLSIVASALFSNAFTKPIIQLSQYMQRTNPEKLEVLPLDLERKDEIGILNRHFVDMLKRTKELIRKIYDQQTTFFEYEIKTLFSQINSHFLFNTLENISSLAEIEGVENITILCKSLGDMIRYTMDYECSIVSLKDEIEHAKEYIAIENIRFEKAIEFTYTMDSDEMLIMPVMKFLLQPIIENSVEHGFPNQSFPWRILLSVKQLGNTLSISVSDNGIGVSPQRAKEINSMLRSVKKPGDMQSIGLYNTQQRLKMFYGSKSHLQIDSNDSGGVSINIFLERIVPNDAIRLQEEF